MSADDAFLAMHPLRTSGLKRKALSTVTATALRLRQLSDQKIPECANRRAPACLRRVERLKQVGLIKGIVALLDNVALDAGMVVLIGVVLDRSTPESFAAFEAAAQKVSGCMECHVVTGEFDYFMLLRTKDSNSFNRLHAEQLLYLPGVRQIRSFMGLRQVLSTTHIPI